MGTEKQLFTQVALIWRGGDQGWAPQILPQLPGDGRCLLAREINGGQMDKEGRGHKEK